MLLAAGLGGLGAYCLLADAIPFEGRGGLIWIRGAPKSAWGVGLLGVGAALHVGVTWSRIPAIAPFRAPALLGVLFLVAIAFLLFL